MKKVSSCILLIALSLGAYSASALDARALVERAISLIESQEYSLARAHLAPALVHPRINNAERSHAYYLRGFSFLAQNMVVSARKDFNRALEFNPDNAAVMVSLGRLHFYGRGIEADPELAFSLFDRASELDYVSADFHIGHAYLVGKGVEKNIVEARRYLSRAAEQDNAHAMAQLGASYRAVHVADPDPELALQWYERAQAAGEQGAVLAIAYMYANGELGEPQPERAFQLYQQAYEEGLTLAAANIAHSYLTGTGVAQSNEQALKFYQQAADEGVVDGYIGLGHLYESGIGVTKDPAQALTWYERAAQADHLDAQLRVSYLYLIEASETSLQQALFWLQRASQQGAPQALNDHAWLLATSKFAGLRDGELALDQAKRAVEQQPSPAYLDTLAAAYAELGDFDQAVATQQQALNEITTDEEDLRDQLEQRLAQYQASKPWRE